MVCRGHSLIPAEHQQGVGKLESKMPPQTTRVLLGMQPLYVCYTQCFCWGSGLGGGGNLYVGIRFSFWFVCVCVETGIWTPIRPDFPCSKKGLSTSHHPTKGICFPSSNKIMAPLELPLGSFPHSPLSTNKTRSEAQRSVA